MFEIAFSEHRKEFLVFTYPMEALLMKSCDSLSLVNAEEEMQNLLVRLILAMSWHL